MAEPSQTGNYSDEFISLREAAKYCRYSQEYLSLRARQGKLKAKKIGRNWVTTRKWLQEYIESVNNNNNKNDLISQDLKDFSEIKYSEPQLLDPFFQEIKRISDSLKTLSDKKKIPEENKKNININVREEAEQVKHLLNEIKEGKSDAPHLERGGGVYQFSEKQKTNREEKKKFRLTSSSNKTHYLNWSPPLRKTVALLASLVFLFGIIGGAFAYPQLQEVKDFVLENFKKTPQIIASFERGLENVSSQISSNIERSGIENAWQKARENLTQGIGEVKNKALMVGKGILAIFKDEKGVPYSQYQKLEQELTWLEERLKQTEEQLSETKALLAEQASKEEQPLVAESGEDSSELGGESGAEFLERKVQQTPGLNLERDQIEKMIASSELSALQKIIALRLELKNLKEDFLSAKSKWQKDLTTTQEKIAKIQEWKSDIQTLRALTSKIQPHPPTISNASAPLYITSNGLQMGGTAFFSDLSVTGQTTLKSLGVGGSVILGTYETDLLTVRSSSVFKSPLQIQDEVTLGSTSTNLTITKEGDLTTKGDITSEGNLTITGNLTVAGTQNYSNSAVFNVSSTEPALKINQRGSGRLIDLQKNGTSQFYIANNGSLVLVGTSTAATYLSASDDSTVRKVGEEVMRAITPIFRYDMPAQTATTTFFRISKAMIDNPLKDKPTVLPGATRVYRLIIKYTDNIPTASTSQWRIYQPSTATVLDTFSLPGRNASNFEEGEPYLTEVLNIPDSDDWQVELKTLTIPDTIRVFQIFLAAYDKVK